MENVIFPQIAIQAWKRLRASRKCTVHAHIALLGLPDMLLGLPYAPLEPLATIGNPPKYQGFNI